MPSWSTYQDPPFYNFLCHRCERCKKLYSHFCRWDDHAYICNDCKNGPKNELSRGEYSIEKSIKHA